MVIAATTGGAALLVAAWLAWGVVSLNTTAQHLRADAQAAMALPAGDATAMLQQLQRSAADVESLTNAPHWQATRWLPRLGANIEALETLAASIGDISRAAEPLARHLDRDASTTDMVMGVLTDQAAITELATAAARADDTLRAASTAGALLPPVAQALDQAREQVASLMSFTNEATRAAPLVADMLGASEQRTWLVMAQNPAEFRGSGGLFSAYLILTIENGKPKILEAGSRKSLDREFPRAEQIPYEQAL